MLPAVNHARSDIPAVTHVDFSARIQTVGPDSNPEFRRLLEAFRRPAVPLSVPRQSRVAR